MTYRLFRQQLVGGTLKEVFSFFKNPANLEAITPPWLGFHVEATTDQEVRKGSRISYRLKLHGIPMRWESRIAEYEEGVRFADEMVSGPYRRWYHEHRFRAVAGGVEITDTVSYELPLGALGRLAHALLVQRQLGTIFDHRQATIADRFPMTTPPPEPEGVLT
ncbi:MAG: SRPBCC family protein [Gemmatimonadota bacterium]|nr:SRPBCC family protein [Gemmatimonadota bacterium]